MRLLVLGGTRFVGRAVVEEALARGWEVDAVHRGVTGALPAGARTITADRTDREQLAVALGDRTWDAVLDTWAQAPREMRSSHQGRRATSSCGPRMRPARSSSASGKASSQASSPPRLSRGYSRASADGSPSTTGASSPRPASMAT